MKNFFLKGLLFSILVLSVSTGHSQNISGIVNPSQNVLEYNFCRNSVIVPATTGFNINDKILLIQMMGATVDTTNTPNSGSIINYGNAGNYEFAIISDIVGNEIFLRDSVQRNYNNNGRIQIVKVAVYNNATIVDTLKCNPWNGLHGGILVLEVSGTLTFNAPIDVSNCGFLGGEKFAVSGLCLSTEPRYIMASLYARIKGEGIAHLPSSQRGGIGAMGNGGGGSGGQEAMAVQTDAWYMGGGGGGNGGEGGRGGKSSTFCSIRWEGGLGGKSLTYSPVDNKIFMAGGGGVGHHRYATTGNEAGTNGGGTVIIKANNVVCNNKTIISNALNVPDTLYNVGRSGGGAGGTVVLEVQNYVGNLNIIAKGGKGGNNSGPSYVGPGGGGGGGVVWVSQTLFPSNINTDLMGGENGLQTQLGNSPWGSTPGSSGTVFTGLSLLQTSGAVFVPVSTVTNIVTNSPVCTGEDITLFSGSVPPNVFYVWNGPNNFTSSLQNPVISNPDTLNSGIYTLEVIVEGCPGPAASTYVHVGAIPATPQALNDTICFGNTTPVLFASGNNITWYADSALSTVLSNDSIFYPNNINVGNYNFYCTQKDSLCESLAKEVSLVVLPTPAPPTVQNQQVCFGEPIQPFIAIGNGVTTWYSDSLLTDTIILGDTLIPMESSPGIYNYYVTFFDTSYLCQSQTQHVTLTISPLPYATVNNDTSLCKGDTLTLFVNYDNSITSTISWSDGSDTPTIDIVPESDTIYYVSIGTTCGIAYDSVSITVNPLPIVTTSPDTLICGGELVQLTASGGSTYLWSHNAGNSDTVIVAPVITTTFKVTVTDTNSCIQTDSTLVTVISHPIAEAGNDTSICDGLSVQLTATGGNTYLWNTGDTTQTIEIIPVNSSHYSVTVSDINNCKGKDSVYVHLWPLPNANAGSNKSVCIGNSDTLNASGGVNYLWSPTIGLDNPAISNPIVTPLSTTTYSVIVSDNHSCSSSDEIIVTVNPLPIVSISPDTVVCGGETVFLTASGGSVYQWSHNAGNTASVSVSPISSTTYTVIVTDTNSCTQMDSSVVSVVSYPPADAGNDTSICTGSSVQISASGGLTYLWNTGDVSPTIDITPDSNQYYIVTVTDINNCSSKDSVLVQLLALPIAFAGNDISICIGNSDTLDASGGQTYQWSPTSGLNDPAISNPIVTPTVTTTYTVTVSDNYSCSTSDQIIVNVNSLPIIGISPDTSVCGGEVVTLTASGGITYQWSHNAGNTATVSVSPVSSTTYTVIVTDTNSCSQIGNTAVTVISYPNASAGNDTSICTGSGVQLTATGGVTYVWNTGDSTSVINATPFSDVYYFVTVTDNFNCSSSDSVHVHLWSLPIVSAGNDIAICSGSSDSLNATGGLSYQWSPSAGLNNPFISNPVVTPSVSTTYTVTAADINSCSATDEIIVIVNPLPIVSASSDTSICIGDSISISAFGGTDYLWSQNAGDSATVVVSPSTTTTYSVTITDAHSCSETDNVIVTTMPLPVIFITGDPFLCENYSTTLTASGGLNYYWNTGVNSPSITVSPMSNETYSVTVTDSNSCSNDESINVSVFPAFYVSMNSDFEPLNEITQGQIIIFTVTPVNLESYDFFINNELVQSGNLNTFSSGSINNNDTVSVIAYNQYGCPSYSESIIVIVKELPNAFTPHDGDGINDIFAEGLDLKIINKWGQELYKGTEGWNGKYREENVSPGTYFYIIELNNNTPHQKTLTGTITLVIGQ
ncbi:MAG: gliding motility-associated C-terminal domain-containing protein [Bacteroidales bacterium]|nr:gliding motility-associated C-terminal domain-containing protein [Bacteroidales bacterium]